ncbi:MAG TPA: TonB family protein [Pyrinomonadaceae bacterium]|nr:TonB family protein [Pyrinomonadaceae bacterium]
MKKSLLLSVFLLAQFAGHAPGTARAQTAASSTPTDQTAALREADNLNVKAVGLYQAAKYDEALPLAEQVLKLREAAVGSDHQAVADAHKNLGAIYLAKGKADKARKHYTHSLSIYEKNPAANKANIYKLLDALGVLERFAFNNYPAAAEHYERSLALRQSAPGAEQEGVIKNLYDLAELYELLGQNGKAVEMHRRVIESRERREATHPDELNLALNLFGCLTERLDMKTETAEARQRIEQLTAASAEKREREAAQQAAQESVDKSVRGGGVLNGKALSKPQPVYPEAAKRRGVAGVVKVFATIDETGKVVEAHPCGHPLLWESTLRAAYAARFSPTLLDGKPVKVRGVITYKFVLR